MEALSFIYNSFYLISTVCSLVFNDPWKIIWEKGLYSTKTMTIVFNSLLYPLFLFEFVNAYHLYITRLITFLYTNYPEPPPPPPWPESRFRGRGFNGVKVSPPVPSSALFSLMYPIFYLKNPRHLQKPPSHYDFSVKSNRAAPGVGPFESVRVYTVFSWYNVEAALSGF